MTRKLAIDGGAPLRSAALAPWPVYEDDEIEAVVATLRSGRVNQWTGEDVNAFEREFAAYVGTRSAVAVANGTVSLELALRAAGVGPGDEVVVAPRTFMASASCVVTVGATPVFADVDPRSGTLTAATIEAALTPRTRAVIPVHLAGWPCPMDEIMDLAVEHHLFVLEDCAQSHGATLYGRQTGSWGHAASFSFCQDKIMSTGGEGGLITTNDEELRRAIWSMKDHGKSWEAVFERDHPPGFRWLHETVGTNLRMTGLSAAIGRRQLRKLDGWIERRQANAATLSRAVADLPVLDVPQPPAHVRHAGYRWYGYVVPERLAPGWDRDRVLAALAAEGLPAMSGSCSEVYLERAFSDRGLAPAAPLPVARQLGERSIAMPLHPTLSEADVRDLAAGLRSVLLAASRG